MLKICRRIFARSRNCATNDRRQRYVRSHVADPLRGIELLRSVYGRVLIPEAVKRELMRTHRELPGFVEVELASNRAEVLRLGRELDFGEAEAIVLAKEAKADLLLIDEKLGRAVALREGLRITGLLGVAVDAKLQGKLSSLREFVAKLENEAGFYVSDAVKHEAFCAAGE